MVRASRVGLFLTGFVYFSQGAIGIAGISLALYLRRLGWSVTEITTAGSIVALPWVMKIFYGLISDTLPLWGYRRKSYLVVCALLAAAGWLWVSFLPVSKREIILALMLANVGFAATDVITDGVIVEHSTQTTSALYQAMAWGARGVGAILSGVLGGWLAAHWAPERVFLLTMALPLTVLVAIVPLRDKKVERVPFRDALTPVRRCWHYLTLSRMKWFMVVLVIASVTASFGIPFFFFMQESLQFSETFLGLLSSISWTGALVGSIVYGRWLRRVAPKTILAWAMFINALNVFSTLLIRDQRTASVLVLVGGMMGCLVILPIMASAAILTHNSGVEGTLFAVLMALYNLGQIVFGFLGGKLYPIMGLHPLIALTGCAALTGLLCVPRLHFERTSRDREGGRHPS